MSETGCLGFIGDMVGLFFITLILSIFFGVVGTVIGVILFFITAAIRVVQIVKQDLEDLDEEG